MRSLYAEPPSWLHRVSAGWKLLLLALLGTLQYLVQDLAWLGVSALLCALLMASLGSAAWSARKALFALLLAALLILGFHSWMQQAQVGWISALRLVSTSLLGISLTMSTRTSDLMAVLERCLQPLQRMGVRSERLALQLAMVLRFTEHFFALWKKLDEAHRLRTGKPGGLRLLAPLTIQMLQAARRVADTLEVRLGE